VAQCLVHSGWPGACEYSSQGLDDDKDWPESWLQPGGGNSNFYLVLASWV
jgi:hypothetical protein